MTGEILAKACQNQLPLAQTALSNSYYYDSLPLCVIDAVFSIGVRYTSVQNVVKHYCNKCGLRQYNLQQDTLGDSHTISQFIQKIEYLGVEQSADQLFCNHQRTSTRNGILKAEAALQFAKVLQRDQVECLSDYRTKGLSTAAQKEIRLIPGQKSGLSLRYFQMLAGDDTQAKPDRHVLRFLNAVLGQPVSVQQAYELLVEAVDCLHPAYPHLTVRLLDYTIWNFMAHGGAVQQTQAQTNMLVRDQSPEIIEEAWNPSINGDIAKEEHLHRLDQRLMEALTEYQEKKSLEKLADLLDVMHAAVQARGWTWEELEQIRTAKAAKQGGFLKKTC